MDKNFRVRLVEAIKRARGDRSQRQFARDLGLSQAAVQSWEKGESIPGLESLEAIAGSLAMTLEGLLMHLKGDKTDDKPLPTVAEDVLLVAKYLPDEEKARLIKLLVDKLVQSKEKN